MCFVAHHFTAIAGVQAGARTAALFVDRAGLLVAVGSGMSAISGSVPRACMPQWLPKRNVTSSNRAARCERTNPADLLFIGDIVTCFRPLEMGLLGPFWIVPSEREAADQDLVQPHSGVRRREPGPHARRCQVKRRFLPITVPVTLLRPQGDGRIDHPTPICGCKNQVDSPHASRQLLI